MNGVPHLPGKPNSVGILLSVGTADVSLNGPSGHRFEEKLRDFVQYWTIAVSVWACGRLLCTVARVQLRPPVVRRHVLSGSAAEPPFAATTFKVGSSVRPIQGFIGNNEPKELRATVSMRRATRLNKRTRSANTGKES